MDQDLRPDLAGTSPTPQTVRTPRYSTVGNQIGPSASLYLDNVNFIIYPAAYSRHAYKDDWEGISELQSTRGKLYDHIGISVPKLEPALAALARKAGVKVTDEPKTWANGKVRSAFVEGPGQAGHRTGRRPTPTTRRSPSD